MIYADVASNNCRNFDATALTLQVKNKNSYAMCFKIHWKENIRRLLLRRKIYLLCRKKCNFRRKNTNAVQDSKMHTYSSKKEM